MNLQRCERPKNKEKEKKRMGNLWSNPKLKIHHTYNKEGKNKTQKKYR